ncbi:zinc finger protein 79-like [Hippocampus zosterae]|uniref:zinc finger protein 79-like n=1 Tax=Hippocampus zosterae TaxID=109293 RepID=UPI00223DF8B2|nr:zinc finger protein 79-like [Hippocampus zosterae]
MCKVNILRELMKQRLNLAVEEIYQLFERTIMEYEEELSRTKEEKERQGQLLGAVLKSHGGIPQADIQEVLLKSPGEEPVAAHPLIKKEEEDVWNCLDGEQPRLPEEEDADVTFTLPDEAHRHSDPESTFAPLSDIDDDCDYGREESFRCSFCHKIFSSKGNMKRHMKSHQQTQKAFACSVCTESFPTRGLLLSHRRRHGANSSDNQKFDCSECGKTFAKLARLNRHMAKHTGEKPFACSFCGKKFTWHYALKRHMRSHSSREHFSCPVCAKGFTTKWYIAVHMRTHTGEKPFQCDVCQKQFHFKNGFKKHTCVGDNQNAVNDDEGQLVSSRGLSN